MATKFVKGRHQPPTAYRVEGATLIVSGKDGTELWRHTFSAQMAEAIYRENPKQCIFVTVQALYFLGSIAKSVGRKFGDD